MNLDLELAGKCNLRCTMCPYSMDFTDDMQGMMPIGMAEMALAEASRMGVKAVKFNYRGEPGLSKHLESLSNYAKSLGFIDIFINTNLLAFSDKRLKRLHYSGLTRIIVSVDGSNKEDYEKIRVGGDFDKLVGKLKILSKTPLKVILQMVSNKPDPALKTFPASEYRFVQVQDRGQGIEKKQGKRRRCPQPRQRLIVAWNGDIFGCCSNWNNEFPLGNYATMSLKQAWEGERMKQLRQISTKCQSFPCKDCQVSGSWK